jgi:hypothetical protein
LLNLLAENGVGVDFMGDFAAYRYLTEELLDEEIDDLRGGWMLVFTPSTPEYWDVIQTSLLDDLQHFFEA